METDVEQFFLLAEHQPMALLVHWVTTDTLLRALVFAHTVPLVLKLHYFEDIVTDTCLQHRLRSVNAFQREAMRLLSHNVGHWTLEGVLSLLWGQRSLA